jgi:outer membrane receptor for ferric coprogen and ferric-rhodotorulic acid
VGLSGAWLDSKITDFTGLNTAGMETDYAGTTIPYTPEIEVRATLDYQWEIGSISPFFGGSISMRSDTNANIGGASALVLTPDFASSVPASQTYTIPGYALVDLRAGIAGPHDAWRLSIFGRNVFNTYYVTNIYTDYDTIARFTGQPATWGMQLAVKFR